MTVLPGQRTRIEVGQKFSRSFHFGEKDISDFATLAGDTNPLHHDRGVAERSRFGSIIASGTHYSALMMGLVADHFAREGDAVGLEFNFQFRKAVVAGSTLTAEWLVAGVNWSEKLEGDVVQLAGTLSHEGVVHVIATGKALAIR